MPAPKILLLAANPPSTQPLALDEEVRAISEALSASSDGEKIEFVTNWATRVPDLQKCLLEQKPTIVQFSGHASASGEILLHSDHGVRHAVAPAAIAGLFRLLHDNVRLVVFNVCHSQAVAEAAAQEIDGCVIGMNTEIGDEAARMFAAAFYRALARDCSVGQAFELGRNALELAKIPEEKTPCLCTRTGVDANAVFPLRPPRKHRVALLAVDDDKTWLRKLRTHLRPLSLRDGFELWDPSLVTAGELGDTVARGLAEARLVVVFVSAWLLGDELFVDSRQPELLRRAHAGSVLVLPLLVSAVAAGNELDIFHPLNPEPLELLSPALQNQALAQAAVQIAAAMKHRG